MNDRAGAGSIDIAKGLQKLGGHHQLKQALRFVLSLSGCWTSPSADGILSLNSHSPFNYESTAW